MAVLSTCADSQYNVENKAFKDIAEKRCKAVMNTREIPFTNFLSIKCFLSKSLFNTGKNYFKNTVSKLTAVRRNMHRKNFIKKFKWCQHKDDYG